MLELFLAALMMVLCIVFLLARLNLRRWLGYTVALDVVVTVTMLGLFAGTFSGVVAGAITGVIFSLTLEILKRVLGYERLTLNGWQQYPPTWSFSSLLTAILATLNAMAAQAPAEPRKHAPKQRSKPTKTAREERIEPTFEGIYPKVHNKRPRVFSVDRVIITNDDWLAA